MLYKLTLASLVLVALSTVAWADEVVITPNNLQGWVPFATGTATAAITSANPRSGNGSIELRTNNASEEAGFSLAGNFGQLSNITNLGFDFYRDGTSTTFGDLAPSLVIRFQSPTDPSMIGDLIWERKFQVGGDTPINQWVPQNITTDTFWLGLGGVPPLTEFKTLSQWLADPRVGNTAVLSVRVQIGSGWPGTFHGFVDNVAINSTTYNFEPIPEPATMLLLGTGLAGIAAKVGRRRRQKANKSEIG